MDSFQEHATEIEKVDCGIYDVDQPSASEKQPDNVPTAVNAVHELKGALHQTLLVKEGNCRLSKSLLSEEDECSSGLDDENLATVDSDMDGLESEPTSTKPLHKCPTVDTQDFFLEDNSLRRAVSLPTARKLVSAMKGSRGKAVQQSPAPRKSVSWAPDVYDPPPSSLTHNPRKKTPTRQQIKGNKKHGKGKQKGKNTRSGGSGPKDKKHYRKVGGGMSERCLATCSDADRVTSLNNYKSSSDFLDFNDDYGDDGGDLDAPDSSCRSSYLGKSYGAMLFAYAEAT